MAEWVCFIAGMLFLLTGLVIFAIELYGAYRYDYVLNRMHMAAFGDTFGIGVSLLGLMIINGFHFSTLKLALIIIFLWCASPVSSHLIARLEAATNENIEAHMEVEKK